MLSVTLSLVRHTRPDFTIPTLPATASPMAETKRKPPKLGPPKDKTNESPAPPAARKPPKLPPKQAPQQAKSNGSPAAPPTARKPPKLPPKQPSQQQKNDQSSTAPAPARKPPKLPPKQPSQQGKSSESSEAPQSARKPPKLPPKQPSQQGNSSESPAAQARRPSTAPRKASNAIGKPSAPARKPSTASQANSAVSQKQEKDDQVSEDQDLKSFLSDEQCADLTFLIASIMGQMRKTIENNFDASAMLNKNLLGDSENKDQSEEDKIMNAKIDPGTVDVGDYDKERKVRTEREKKIKKPETQKLKQAALKWFDDWREVVLKRVGEVVSSKKTATEQKKQAASQEEDSIRPTPSRVQSVQKINTSAKSGEYSAPKLEELFPRIRTPLTKLSMDKRVLVLHSILLLLLSLEHYNAASRVLLLNLASSLKLGLKYLREDEEKTGKGLLEAAKSMSADEERRKKVEESKQARKWKVGLATAAGAAVIGISGGMAAPMIAAGVGSVMGGLGLGATAAAGYLGSVAGSTALVGSLFGAYGGRMTGQMMENLSAEVEDFAFLPIHGERKEHDESAEAATDSRRLRVIIAVTGWLLEKEEVVTPWRVLKPSAEVFALRFELEALMNLGQSINTMISSAAWGYAQSALIQRTVFAELMSAMWPMALIKVARVVDNPFSLAKTRADKAGEVLAEALINKAQGERPVTLIGYSLGARVIWSCLTTLAKRRAFGLVESVVMIGSPIPSDTATWRLMRAAVSGRLVNVYSTNDYLLAFLYRTSSLQYGVAGLMPIEGLPSIENVDVSETVSGHLRYRYLVGAILQKIGFEDVDNDEVEKEAKAFEAMVEEEKKHNYVEEAKENAGELYDKYGKRIKKDGKKRPEKAISDADADKQASAMEKDVQAKTEKGLMQWAVEQLYISRPSVPSTGDAKDAASNPQGAISGASKTAKKTTDAATKSLYQRAKDAAYLSRSGGPEGEQSAKDKLADAQKTASSAAPSSYLQTAAGYIPTSYIPGIGASGKATKNAKGPVDDAQKKAGEAAKQASKATGNGQKTVEDATKPALKKTASAQKAVGDAAKPVPKKTASSQKKLGEAVKDPSKTADDVQKAVGDAAKDPSKAANNAQQKVSDAGGEVQKTTGEATKTASKTAGGVSSYIPSFGLGGSSKKDKPAAPKRAPSSSKTDKPKAETGKAAKDASKSTGNAAEDVKKKSGEAGKGYSSYLPSFGLGGSSKDKTDTTKTTDSAQKAANNTKDKSSKGTEEAEKAGDKTKDTASKGTEEAEGVAEKAKGTASKGAEEARKIPDNGKDAASKGTDEGRKVADTASSPESKPNKEETSESTKEAAEDVASPDDKSSPSESPEKAADDTKNAGSKGTGEAKAIGSDLLAQAGGPMKSSTNTASGDKSKGDSSKGDDSKGNETTSAASSAGNAVSSAASPFTKAASSAGESVGNAASTASNYTPKFSGLGGDAGSKLGEVASGTASGAKSGASFLGKEAGDAAQIAGGAQSKRGEATQAASDKAGEAVDDATKGEGEEESKGYGKAASGLAGVGSRDKMMGGAVGEAGQKASEASGKEEGSGYVEGAKNQADPFVDDATEKGKGYLGSAADGAKGGAGAVGGAASSAGSAAASGAGSVASGMGSVGKGIGKGFGFGG